MKDKYSTLGVGPECVESEGDIITNVQSEAGIGECMHRTKGWIYQRCRNWKRRKCTVMYIDTACISI